MNNELVKLENGEITIAESVIKEINKFQRAKLKMDIMQEKLKENIKSLMEETGVAKYTSPDGTIVINYYPERTTNRFSSTDLKKEDIDTYNKYLKPSTTKAYVKLTVK